MARAAAGKFNGGPIPFGYRLHDGRLVINEAEAAVVRRMFELAIEKHIVRRIRLALNASGSRTRKGYAWACETIRRILTSPLYVGELVYNKRDASSGKAKPRAADEHIRVPGAVPTIVCKEVFAQVQAILAEGT